jgi:endonuclease/exonuclease/phosphatase family metal-dependent hydrolase
LRIVSYNIHHCRGLDGRVDLKRIATLLRNADPDLVALQEVDRNTKRSGNIDQSSELARLTGMYESFAKAIDFEGGEYGQSILSRFPVKDLEITKLANRDNREQRIAASSLIDMANGYSIQFLSTHLDNSEPNIRLEQATQLKDLGSRDAFLSILAGDMNASPESNVMAKLMESWSVPSDGENLPTVPAASPKRQIDYVLLRSPSPPIIGSSRVIEEPVASDHRPIFLSIELPMSR